jgi:hypothetical protein
MLAPDESVMVPDIDPAPDTIWARLMLENRQARARQTFDIFTTEQVIAQPPEEM